MKKIFITALLLVTMLSTFALAQDPGTPDTCWVERLEMVPPNSQIVVNVYLTNDEAIGGFAVPLVFPDTVTNLDITCDSVSFVGTRSSGLIYGSDSTSVDNDKNKVVAFAFFVVTIPAGTGSIAKIYFSTGSAWDSTQSVPIDTSFWPPTSGYEFSTDLGASFYPIFLKGALEVREVNAPATPKVFSLSQNYPNPFNPKTVIRFGLPKDSWVNLDIYNVLGQRVRALVDERLSAGMKEVEWDGKDDKGFEVSSGIYFYKIKAGDFSDIKKMVMLK